MNSKIPLIVDLDGTLIRTDMLHESVINCIHREPKVLFKLPFWLKEGKATLKHQLALRCQIDPKTLPYSTEFLEWLKQERESGRKIVLCTATNILLAQSISEYLGLFDEVLASDATKNLSGSIKAATLVELYGKDGFAYAGNSTADLPVWREAGETIAVNTPPSCLKKLEAFSAPEKIFSKPAISWRQYLRAMRVHQWLKNILLFVPFVAAHAFTNIGLWGLLLVAFMSFNLCASAVYVINDLLDIENDRHHKTKRLRPLACGDIPAIHGTMMAVILLGLAGVSALSVSGAFFLILGLYFCITNVYSVFLKSVLLVDCITLAMLYTIRIIAGVVAIETGFSFWILAFSVFIFFSLAVVKRYAELKNKLESGEKLVYGRAYLSEDLPALMTFGIASGYMSVLVLALYIDSATVKILYSAPELIWGTLPIMLFWISWIWMQAHRGYMHEDPIVFAIKDRASLICAVLMAGIFILADVG